MKWCGCRSIRRVPELCALPSQRLHKALAVAGVASRRHSEELIQAGRVAVNGATITTMGQLVDPDRDEITVDGKPVHASTQFLYLILHKPAGYLTSMSDDHGRQTVQDLLPPLSERVFPVGRLDLASEGLLLLTNDGDLANRLTHPRYGIEREYRVQVPAPPTEPELQALLNGSEVEGREVAPKSVAVEPERRGPGDEHWLRVVLTEGRKREVRVLCQAAGLPVLRLVRVRYGPISLGRLRPGQVRPALPREVQALQRAMR